MSLFCSDELLSTSSMIAFLFRSLENLATIYPNMESSCFFLAARFLRILDTRLVDLSLPELLPDLLVLLVDSTVPPEKLAFLSSISSCKLSSLPYSASSSSLSAKSLGFCFYSLTALGGFSGVCDLLWKTRLVRFFKSSIIRSNCN